MTKLLLYVVGNGLLLLGLGGLTLQIDDAIAHESENPFLGLALAISFGGLGVFALLAASERYNGGWSSAIGLCVIAVGILFLGGGMDEAQRGNREHLVTGLLFFSVLPITIGAILVRSGHRAHVLAQHERQLEYFGRSGSR
jgi:hypothetical protein